MQGWYLTPNLLVSTSQVLLLDAQTTMKDWFSECVTASDAIIGIAKMMLLTQVHNYNKVKDS